MGANNSIRVSSALLPNYYLGKVVKNNEELDMYYVPKKYIFTVPSDQKIADCKTGEIDIPFSDLYDYNNFLLASKIKQSNDIELRHFKNREKDIKTDRFHFMTQEDHQKVFKILNSVNMSHRDGKERYIAVIVNPISGQKKSLQYYQTVLKPILESAGIKHDMYQTDSEHYVHDLISTLDLEKNPYSDFVLISGDGTFNQVVNAYFENPFKDELLKIPIGFVPGGSANCNS